MSFCKHLGAVLRSRSIIGNCPMVGMPLGTRDRVENKMDPIPAPMSLTV